MTLRLATGGLRAALLPGTGAAILSLEALGPDGAWVPVLQAPDAVRAAAGEAAQAAHFPMLPWVNRLPDSALEVDGRRIAIAPNTAEALPLHGTGWLSAWEVAEAGPAGCLLRCRSPDGFPVRFEAWQRLDLAGLRATLTLGLANTGGEPIPVGLGFHPYLPRRPGTRLRFAADWFWLEGPGHLPTDPIRVPPELDFAEGRPLPRTWRANCYSGRRGDVGIEQPELGYDLRMTASDWLPDLMLYAPPDAPVFAIEPQSHTTGVASTSAAGPAATPMTRLASGERVEARMGLELRWRDRPGL